MTPRARARRFWFGVLAAGVFVTGAAWGACVANLVRLAAEHP